MARAGVSIWAMKRAPELKQIVETTPAGRQRLFGHHIDSASESASGSNRVAYGASIELVNTHRVIWQKGASAREHGLTKEDGAAIVDQCVSAVKHNSNIEPITEAFIPGGFRLPYPRFDGREAVQAALTAMARNWETWETHAAHVHLQLDHAIYQNWNAGVETYVEREKRTGLTLWTVEQFRKFMDERTGVWGGGAGGGGGGGGGGEGGTAGGAAAGTNDAEVHETIDQT